MSFSQETTFEVIHCTICGISFGLPKHYIDNKQDDKTTFKCPNDHALSYPNLSRVEILTQLTQLKTQVAEQSKRFAQQTAFLDQLEAELESLKKTPPEGK